MPTILLGNKRRQFKQLSILQSRRLARRNDPLSAYQHEHHRNALLYVQEILKQSWSVLLLERRFMSSYQSYTEYLSKSDVIDKLLAALESYEDCLSHQADKPSDVRYDLTEFERKVSVAILEVHSMGSESLLSGVAQRPKAGWQCMKECVSWEANRIALMDKNKRKVRAREWVVPELGELMDGVMSVTIFDEDGGERGVAPLAGTLSGPVKETCAKAGEETSDAEGEAEDPTKQRSFLKVPQGRNLRLRVKREFEEAIRKLERGNDADSVASAATEEKPTIRPVLRRQQIFKVEEE